jgi:oligopeptide transport system substrate-binding protein
MQKKIYIILVICTVFFLSAHSELLPEENHSQDHDTSPQEFTIALLRHNFSLNPFLADEQFEFLALEALFEGLVCFHPVTFEPIPACAQRWNISDDGCVYTFYLRENACFSNGDMVHADDIRESWLALIHPETKGTYASYFDIIKGAADFRNGINSNPESVGIHVISQYVFEVELEKPAQYFLKLLSMINFAPTHVLNRLHNEWENANSIIGNGPFSVHEQTKDTLILKKNKYYWDADNVKVEKICIRFFNAETEISEEYNRGKIHWALHWDFAKLENKSHIRIGKKFATMYYFFMCAEEPWNDERVRRGLALLLPWETLRDESKFPSSSFVPSIPGYPRVEGIKKQNSEQGLALLKQAGFPQGEGLPKIVILQEKGVIERAELMAKAWREQLEVQVAVEEAGEYTFFEDLKNRAYTLSSWVWLGDFPDPLAFLLMYSSQSNLNNTHYVDPEYDDLLHQALGLKGRERYEKLAEAERLLLEKAAVLPIYNAISYDLINLDEIEGWYANPFDYHPLKYIELKDPKMIPGVVKYNE